MRVSQPSEQQRRSLHWPLAGAAVSLLPLVFQTVRFFLLFVFLSLLFLVLGTGLGALHTSYNHIHVFQLFLHAFLSVQYVLPLPVVWEPLSYVLSWVEIKPCVALHRHVQAPSHLWSSVPILYTVHTHLSLSSCEVIRWTSVGLCDVSLSSFKNGCKVQESSCWAKRSYQVPCPLGGKISSQL